MQVPRYEHQRLRLKIPAQIYIVLLEETSRPQRRTGIIVDLSLHGLKVFLPDVDPDFEKKLMRSDRYMRVSFFSPIDEIEVRLTGRIVWLNYSSKERRLEAAMLFEELQTLEVKALKSILLALEKQKELEYIPRVQTRISNIRTSSSS